MVVVSQLAVKVTELNCVFYGAMMDELTKNFTFTIDLK